MVSEEKPLDTESASDAERGWERSGEKERSVSRVDVSSKGPFRGREGGENNGVRVHPSVPITTTGS